MNAETRNEYAARATCSTYGEYHATFGDWFMDKTGARPMFWLALVSTLLVVCVL